MTVHEISMGGGRWLSERGARALLVLLVIASTTAEVRSQGGVEPDPPLLDPPVTGSWDGPWRLGSQINPPGRATYSELAHAVLLPPPNGGWVLMWCARYCSDAPFSDNRTFLWHPSDPGTVHEMLLPDVPGYLPGEVDLFCGGLALSPDGHPIVFGGTDLEASCAGPSSFFGQRHVWVLDNSVTIDIGLGLLPAWIHSDALMALDRWYATTVRLARLNEATDKILVAGHVGLPQPSPPIQQQREYGHLDGVSKQFVWDTGALRNWRYEDGQVPPADCDTTQPIFVPDYAHLHQLKDGRVLCVVAGSSGIPGAPDSPSIYLERGLCPADPTDPDRWRFDMTQPLEPGRDGAPSIHIVDSSVSPVKEWIWTIGGAEDENGCGMETTDQVLVMEDPGPTKDWQLAPSMNHARNSANAVVGLDGAIVVVGGVGPCTDGCLGVFNPESYRPPQIFRTGNTSTWKPLWAHKHQRSYHSFLVLLPNGKMVCGGGTLPIVGSPDPCTVPPPPGGAPPCSCNHTVEVFSPPSLYLGPRPGIVTINGQDPDSTVVQAAYTPPANRLTLEVVLHGTYDDEFRVALLQPGAVTHAFNTNQRYIKLDVDTMIPTGEPVDPPGLTTLEVLIPSSPNVAPPGYYLLTVVDSDGSPAQAKWIHIQY